MAASPVLSASLVAAKDIKLTWVPQDDGSPPWVTTYISRSPDWGSGTKSVNYSVTEYHDTDVEDGTPYTYHVRHRMAVPPGTYSNQSNAAAATTTLAAPSQMDGSAVSTTECDTTWHINSVNHTGVKLFMDGSLLITLGKVTHYEKTGLQEGSTHTWKVDVYNSYVTSSFSNTVSITQKERPTAPSLCTAVGISTSVIRTTCKDNSDNETGFKVYGSDSPTSGFSQIGTTGRNVTTFDETGLSSNKTRYYYWKAYNDGGTSSASNTAAATTFAAIAVPTTLQVFPISGTVADIIMQNNSSAEDDTRVERAPGSPLLQAIIDGGIEVWTDANTPTNFTVTKVSTSTVVQEATTIHSGLYSAKFTIDATNHNCYLSPASGSFTMTAGGAYTLKLWYKNSVAAKTTYILIRDTGSHQWLTSAGTWQGSAAAIVLPNNTTGTLYSLNFSAHASYSTYYIEFGHNSTYSTATSSSFYMDDLSIEGAGWAETTTLAPNQDAARETGLTAGTQYSWRARARQGVQYSAYCPQVAATTLSVPGQVTGVSLTEVQDTTLRVNWAKIAGVTGYKVEQSPHGAGTWTTVNTVWGDDILSLKVWSLVASTSYDYRVSAYNGAGYGAVSATVNTTTLAVYARNALELYLRKNVGTLVFLLEISPKRTLSGFTLTAGKTYTYEIPVDPAERGIKFYALYANGMSYTAKTSTADVEATASTFWHDYYNNKLYVHMAAGDDPVNYFVEGAFWLYFTSFKQFAYKMVFNGNNYLPYFEASDVPNVSQSISRLFEGNTTFSSGTIRLKNPRMAGGLYYWDARYGLYTWENRPLRILMGGPSFTYSQFDYYMSGLVNNVDCGDKDIVFDFRDPRSGLSCQLPPNFFTSTAYPNADPNILNQRIPFFMGTIPASVGFVPPCVDTTKHRYQLQDGRMKGSETVYKGTTLLTGGTDYYVDYQRGRITLSKTLTLNDSDKIKVSFSGAVNSADESYENGAEQYRYLMTTWLGLAHSELNLDSIYRTKALRTQAVCTGLTGEVSSDDVIRSLEHSVQAYSFQDAQARIGLRVLGTTAPSSSPLVQASMIADDTLRCQRGLDQTAAVITVYYNRDFSKDNAWSVVTLTRSQDIWQKRAVDDLDPFYTNLTGASDAQDCLSAISDALARKPVKFSTSQILFYTQPGDIILMTRSRFPGVTGLADALPVIVLSIDKNMGSRQTDIVGEAIA